jgi:hypothetical protein
MRFSGRSHDPSVRFADTSPTSLGRNAPFFRSRFAMLRDGKDV